jgi:hypothetical protein
LRRYARNDEVPARNDEVVARRPQADAAIWGLLAGLLLILSAAAAHASDRSIRCGNNLVHAGGGKDSSGMYEVLKKCGEPVAKHGNTWIYEQGNMNRVLTFNHQGRLQTIESRRN